MVDDKYIVLTLALLGTIGIGAVVTKMELTAAADGTSATDNMSYLKNPIWWAGMSACEYAVVLVANFAAYTFALAQLLLHGNPSFQSSAILASFLLDEHLGHMGHVGCGLCLLGSSIIVLHAPEDAPSETVTQFLEYAVQPGFLLYCVSELSLMLNAIRFAPIQPWRRRVLRVQAKSGIEFPRVQIWFNPNRVAELHTNSVPRSSNGTPLVCWVDWRIESYEYPAQWGLELRSHDARLGIPHGIYVVYSSAPVALNSLAYSISVPSLTWYEPSSRRPSKICLNQHSPRVSFGWISVLPQFISTYLPKYNSLCVSINLCASAGLSRCAVESCVYPYLLQPGTFNAQTGLSRTSFIDAPTRRRYFGGATTRIFKSAARTDINPGYWWENLRTRARMSSPCPNIGTLKIKNQRVGDCNSV
ncbi:magnesium transporter NIPA-domain-containing protein [Mycena filopes]|nr:magnesium transporter NIPA-domain-containing protein [Mycena filopes]